MSPESASRIKTEERGKGSLNYKNGISKGMKPIVIKRQTVRKMTLVQSLHCLILVRS